MAKATKIFQTGGRDRSNQVLQSSQVVTIPYPLNETTFVKAVKTQDFPVRTEGGVGARLKNELVICGGSQEGRHAHGAAGCWSKKPGEPSWTLRSKMGYQRWWAAGAFFKSGLLWVTGGTGGGSGSSEVYDNGRWRRSTPMPEATWCHSVCELGQRQLVLTGGKVIDQGDYWSLTSDRAFFHERFSFREIAPLTRPRSSHKSFYEKIHGKGAVIVVGGEESPRTSEYWDNESQSWKEGPELPRDFWGGAVITDEFGRNFLVGGCIEDGRVMEYEDGQFKITNVWMEPRRYAATVEVPPEYEV